MSRSRGARDAVVVTGAKRTTKLPEGCWYSLVRAALEKDEADFKEISGHGYGFEEKVFRWRYRPAQAIAETPPAASAVVSEPSWLRGPFADSSHAPARPDRRADGPVRRTGKFRRPRGRAETRHPHSPSAPGIAALRRERARSARHALSCERRRRSFGRRARRHYRGGDEGARASGTRGTFRS